MINFNMDIFIKKYTDHLVLISKLFEEHDRAVDDKTRNEKNYVIGRELKEFHHIVTKYSNQIHPAFFRDPAILKLIQLEKTPEVARQHRILLKIIDPFLGILDHTTKILTNLYQKKCSIQDIPEQEKKIAFEHSKLNNIFLDYENDAIQLIKTEAPELLSVSGVGSEGKYKGFITGNAMCIAFLISLKNSLANEKEHTKTIFDERKKLFLETADEYHKIVEMGISILDDPKIVSKIVELSEIIAKSGWDVEYELYRSLTYGDKSTYRAYNPEYDGNIIDFKKKIYKGMVVISHEFKKWAQKYQAKETRITKRRAELKERDKRLAKTRINKTEISLDEVRSFFKYLGADFDQLSENFHQFYLLKIADFLKDYYVTKELVLFPLTGSLFNYYISRGILSQIELSRNIKSRMRLRTIKTYRDDYRPEQNFNLVDEQVKKLIEKTDPAYFSIIDFVSSGGTVDLIKQIFKSTNVKFHTTISITEHQSFDFKGKRVNIHSFITKEYDRNSDELEIDSLRIPNSHKPLSYIITQNIDPSNRMGDVKELLFYFGRFFYALNYS